jgi:glycosyltransferase involved in cell wall biosynthesis
VVSSSNYSISCVIPAYNEASHISSFVVQLLAELHKMSKDVEIIVVDDGSQDDTFSEMLSFSKKQEVSYLKLTRNFGKEAAITAGLSYSSGDIVYIMDADFQHPFKYMHEMLDAISLEYDMVYAYPETRQKESFLMRWVKAIYYNILLSPDEIVIPPNAGDFRLIKRNVVTDILSMGERARYMKGIYAWVGHKVLGIPYKPDKRFVGRSRFSFKKLLSLAIQGITSFSTAPLKLLVLFGFSISALSFIYALYIIFRTLFYGSSLGGWPSLIVSIMFFSGVQLFAIGILGLYIGKVYLEAKLRPLYLVDKQNSFNIKMDPS